MDILVEQNIDEITVEVINDLISYEINISELGDQGIDGESAYEVAVRNGFIGTEIQWLESLQDKILIKVSGESIPSYTPIAIYNNLAYKFNNLNPQHQFAFVGFSTNGTLIGQNCRIKQSGELYLQNWGLIPNTQYLAGELGVLQTVNSNSGFTKVIGYATTADTLQIIKDYTTINK